MENKKFLKGFIGGIVSACLIFMLLILLNQVVGFSAILNPAGSTRAAEGKNSSAIGSPAVEAKMKKIKKVIDQYYLNDASDEKLVDGMYKGLVSGLDDRYSVYYTKEEYNDLVESTNGIYCGIGVVVTQNQDTGVITLVKPYENSPGMKAGILPGDILYKVDGTEVTGMELNKVVAMIKGEEGSKVHLTIYRKDAPDYIELDVTREKIEVPTISHDMLKDKIGYIAILEFDEVTASQFDAALKDLRAQGMKGLIVDLRDNPGGRLDIVNSILDKVLPEGLIVYTEDKNGKKEEYKSDAEHYLSVPLAVLINGNSASASEIFAGAVKDYGIGTLVGTTSFGKGIVQKLIELGDGTAMKLTVEKYYTPKGNNIQGTGIKPDITVDLSDKLKTQAVITKEEDNQLQKALEVIEEKLKQ